MSVDLTAHDQLAAHDGQQVTLTLTGTLCRTDEHGHRWLLTGAGPERGLMLTLTLALPLDGLAVEATP
jgi:hypothetical protein